MESEKEHSTNILDYSSSFADLQADFYQYLRTKTNLSKKACGDYVSRLKFLANKYPLDRNFNASKIKDIMNNEKEDMQHRDRYNNAHAMSDFHSGLVKFLAFIDSGFLQEKEQQTIDEINEVENSTTLSKTEKDSIVKSRIGQGLFRQRLFSIWHSCAITSCDVPWFLMASHIKPWRDSDNQERLDAYNGLLLIPNYDKMFDKGYISFSTEGKIIISPLLTSNDRKELKLSSDAHLRFIAPQHQKYLEYHREHCLLR